MNKFNQVDKRQFLERGKQSVCGSYVLHSKMAYRQRMQTLTLEQASPATLQIAPEWGEVRTGLGELRRVKAVCVLCTLSVQWHSRQGAVGGGWSPGRVSRH